jgi:hypothetical protein
VVKFPVKLEVGADEKVGLGVLVPVEKKVGASVTMGITKGGEGDGAIVDGEGVAIVGEAVGLEVSAGCVGA